MAVVTLNGQIGAVGAEVGSEAARLLNADYVDRLVLAEAAKRMGSTVEVLEIKGQRKLAIRDRLGYFFQTLLERSAVSGEGELYSGLEYLPAVEYTELAREPMTAAQRLDDQHFIEATSTVIKDLARAGDVIINGRGSNLILRDMLGVLHVGLLAPMELRIKTIIEREHLNREEAERYVRDTEQARLIYFKKFFKVSPEDPSLYDIVLNMGTMSLEAAAAVIALAASKLEPPGGLESR